MSQIGGPKIGGQKHEPINIGTEATPPFAVLPEVKSLFQRRAHRLGEISASHELKSYLEFVARICDLQHQIASSLPAAAPLPADLLAQSKAGAMPPLAGLDLIVAPEFKAALSAITTTIEGSTGDWPAEAVAAAKNLAALDDDALVDSVVGALRQEIVPGAVAEHVLLSAALQVHMSRLAASLDADQLVPVADGVCPACGSPPVASAVVGWPSAQNTRFCTCSMCATQWNVVRVKCVTCGSTGGIGYYGIDGQPNTLKGETCANCKSYVKILYQVNDAALDPLADDVATLALDLKLAEAGWTRRAANLFLAGYGSETPTAAPAQEAV
ncbi:MAG: formate dehydrogenase accessory protein FdhE [Hyphomicrobiaceae bacterium]